MDWQWKLCGTFNKGMMEVCDKCGQRWDAQYVKGMKKTRREMMELYGRCPLNGHDFEVRRAGIEQIGIVSGRIDSEPIAYEGQKWEDCRAKSRNLSSLQSFVLSCQKLRKSNS